MRSKIILIGLCSAVAACNTSNYANRGVESVNVPVVTSADYVFDAAAPDGALAPAEASRLQGWFQGLGLGYGDTIYVDGPFADSARAQVAAIAGQYGLTVLPGAPVTAGMVQPGSIRVIVSRRRAVVPNCPNWSIPSEPNFNNHTSSNYGCSVNTNLAAMVANPEDLVHGREGVGVGDNDTAAKAVLLYRSTPPSGAKGLTNVNTKQGNQ